MIAFPIRRKHHEAVSHEMSQLVVLQQFIARAVEVVLVGFIALALGNPPNSFDALFDEVRKSQVEFD